MPNRPAPRAILLTESTRVGLVLAAIFAAAAVNSAFLPLWFADRGLSPADIGTVLAAASVLRVVAVPGGGWLSDHLGRRRTVLGVAAAIAALAAATLPALRGVWALGIGTAILGVAASLLTPLMDAVTVALSVGRRLDYGRTRAWGSVSYMLATAGAGTLLSRVGTAAVPALLACGYGLAALCTAALPATGTETPARTGAAALLRNPAFRLSLAASALIQGSHAAYYSFAPLLWRAHGYTDSAVGLLIGEGIIAEILLFLWGRAAVEHLGPARLTALAATAGILRWSILAATTALPLLIAAQLLHAATFALQYLATIQVMRRLSPARAGTAQTLMSACGFSLPTGLLVWLTGQLYAPLGSLVFLPMAALCAAALLLVPPLRRATTM